MNPLSRIAAMLGVSLLCLTATAETAPELVARYEKLTLGAPVAVSNLAISSGSMKITLGSGSAATVKAGDEVIGLFFKGQGSFSYSANDAVELPIMQTNLRNTKTTAAVVEGVLRDSFSDALIVTSNVNLPALEGAAGESLDDAFVKSRTTFSNDQETRLSIELARHQLIAKSQRFFRAEMRGAQEWLYNSDHTEESLSRLYGIDFDDRARRVERYEAPISEKPIGRTRADIPPYDVMLTALDYSLVASDGRDVSVTATETLMPRTNGANGIVLDVLDTVYADGPKPRQYHVKSVTMEDGKPLPFVHALGMLLVSLPQQTMAASPIKLKFEMSGDILVRAGGDNQWILTTNWYPAPPLAAQATSVHGVIKVKAPFVPLAGGRTIARKTEGDYNVVETQIDQPIAFAFVTAGKYTCEEEKRDALTIRSCSYGQKNPRGAKKLNALAFDVVKYYEYVLGPFPAEELNIVEVNDLGWGQSPAGMVFITSEAFKTLITEQQLGMVGGYAGDINQVLAHEIAHQYWGSAVRMPSLEEQWLTEAFAEYSSAFFVKKFEGEGEYKRMVAHWKADANESHNLAPIPLANRITTPNNWDANRDKLLYGKGSYLLYALNKQVGDEAFMTFLKSYQKSFHNKLGTTKDVAGLLGFMTKQDFKPFFDKYYWGTEVPEIK